MAQVSGERGGRGGGRGREGDGKGRFDSRHGKLASKADLFTLTDGKQDSHCQKAYD